MPKARTILVSAEAVADIEQIAEPLLTQVLNRIRILKRFPRLGARLAGEFSGVRATTVGMFRIFYRVTLRGIEIIYVRHCKRRPPTFEEQ